MTRWLIAAIIGLMVAALHYGRSLGLSPDGGARQRDPGRAGLRRVAAALRAIAAATVAAMLLGAPAGPARAARPLVALDVSASWTRGDAAAARWARVRDAARRSADGDSLLLFGDSTRMASAPPARPGDQHSTLAPLLDLVRDDPRGLVLVTDGELAEAGPLPAGTRLTVRPAPPATDIAVVALIAPGRVAPGDTVSLSATVRAGNGAIGGATVRVALAGAPPVILSVGPLGAFAEHEISARLIAPPRAGDALLQVSAAAAGDVESRNDTLGTIVEISRVPSAVLVSSSPDPDARAALAALAGALTVPPRGYYLVAPGAWRDATTLRAVTAADVRAAAAAAPLLVLHGDSLILGPPAQLARSALVLMVPGDIDDAEWRAAPTGASPLARSLGGIAWDSIPPIEVAPVAPRGDWIAVEGRSPGLGSRALVAGSDISGRRQLVVAASGMWRWRARGGPPRDAFDALWGAIADWTTSVGVDLRPALPSRRSVREGDPIAWTRTGVDSVVALTLRRTDDATRDTTSRSLSLRFTGDSRTTTTASLPPGRYTAFMRGGSASIVVNAGTELLPARAVGLSVASVGARSGVPAAPLRDQWWAYLLAVAALCGEWIIRRRSGLR